MTPRPHNLLAILFALEGEFWKNPLIKYGMFYYGELLRILPKASLAVFFCISEDWLKDRIADEKNCLFRSVAGVWIKDYSSDPRGKRLYVHFETGEENIYEEGIIIYSVVSYCCDNERSDYVGSVCSDRQDDVEIQNTPLPANLSTARWWLYGTLDEWILFSYELKKMYVGPDGTERPWVETCDYSAFYDDWEAGLQHVLRGRPVR
jgi:hypothetical protein